MGEVGGGAKMERGGRRGGVLGRRACQRGGHGWGGLGGVLEVGTRWRGEERRRDASVG